MKWESTTIDKDGLERFPLTWPLTHYVEALSVLFRVENALRVFTYIILKAERGEQWMGVSINSQGEPLAISAIAKQRYAQDKDLAYLGFPSACPLLHLTAGELIDIILNEKLWPLFKQYFPTTRDMLKTKLLEIVNIRNAFAHFRPLQPSDVATVRHNSEQMLPLVEKCIDDFINCGDTVPTNTTDPWYMSATRLKSDHTTSEFFQNADSRWIRISLSYKPSIVKPADEPPSMRFYFLTTHKLLTRNILDKCPIAKQKCIALIESANANFSPPDTLDTTQRVDLYFPKSILEIEYEKITSELATLLSTIDNESNLVASDHLARGELIHTAWVLAQANSDNEGNITGWTANTSNLLTPISESDPVEYWGAYDKYSYNGFISHTPKFPWMQAPFGRPSY